MKKVRIIPLLLAVILVFASCTPAYKTDSSIKVNKEEFNTNYKYIFVHGLSGWGSYDFQNHFLKHWGMTSGDLLKYLNEQGFDCYSASVAPAGSAWDRACELYAQLTGSVVDYGKEHSERCKHERFGEDYSKKPLIEKWDSENKINLIGQSFGGATVRLFAELMKNGSEAEQKATDKDDISPFFTGGKADWIYSLTALAAPHNGTSAYEAGNLDYDVESELSSKQKTLNKMMSSATAGKSDGRIDSDYANYDLKIDNAAELNKRITTLENVYYFSYPCSSTDKTDDGTYRPDTKITEDMFVKSSILMGMCKCKTEGGFEITDEWLENDGLVNTISAKAPFNEPQKVYEKGKVKTGEWNIMPTYRGDHLSMLGGLNVKNDLREFYVNHLTMINEL